jgi:hypothetical protein
MNCSFEGDTNAWEPPPTPQPTPYERVMERNNDWSLPA